VVPIRWLIKTNSVGQLSLKVGSYSFESCPPFFSNSRSSWSRL
jgi:hypothetical protein